MVNDCHSRSDPGSVKSLWRCGIDADRDDFLQHQEIATCRSIANRCAFVMGPARSGTTILAQVVNANDKALLTTEANFYLAGAYPDFRDWYNKQHHTFKNQVSKVSYAPNFVYPDEKVWWKWLAQAAGYFEVVGDKMAFSSPHIQSLTSYELMSFFEARFYSSKYIFVFRDPVQTILSGAALLWFRDAVAAIISWVSTVKLWADFIRVFPGTMTVLHSELDHSKITEIGNFLGLDLSESTRLLDHRQRIVHKPENYECGAFTVRIAPLLQMIYSEIQGTVAMERVLLQSDQKRHRQDGGQRSHSIPSSKIAVVSTPVGRAWNLADQLLNALQARAGANSTLQDGFELRLVPG